MSLCAFIMILFSPGIFQEGSAVLVQTQETVMATAGEEVCLRCQLMESKEVHQVTWQKSVPGGEKNMATYSRFSGERVNPDFQGKVEFRKAGLLNSSIVIKEVTEQDEGCYRCLFNTWPHGALPCSTCLKLYELHGPVLQVRESNFSEEVNVSCWASARPAPTVTLRVQHQELNSFKHTDNNENGTVTVRATAVLQRRFENSTEVECVVQVPSVPPRSVSDMIPEFKPPSADKDKTFAGIIVPAVIVAGVLVVFVCLAAVYIRRKYKNSLPKEDPEEIKTPLKLQEDHHGLPKKDPGENQTPTKPTGVHHKRLSAWNPNRPSLPSSEEISEQKTLLFNSTE
ncbi:OX-2 membrane glycoprotein-like isoform X3 [Xyrichtys novacula]|uniref:OX-2 membrane glycoprotein-like isoform X3 n=1 Tax=Xyrichtys novacula TaxID=13765 RepID=A0AAV1HSZ6_XYRNO|nr:OX-2 membrane glycoprotein-like isoform X3 [Xyrichtys novacula]